MPIQYQGILAEHTHTRTCASIFDTCHMGEFEFRGPTALEDLERLVTFSVASIREGQCRYGYMLNPAGGVIDDLTVFRRGSDHFFAVVNAGTLNGDADWMRAHLCHRTTFTDLSPDRAKLDIQGPEARAELEAALGHPLPDLRYFRFTDTRVAGVPCTLSRTGYTGEFGYEIFFPIERAGELWERIVGNSRIAPAGLGARDTLRLEVGYPLYGHELTGDRTPAGAAGGSFIDRTKTFVGSEPLLDELNSGPKQVLAGLKLETKRAARDGDVVVHDGRPAGIVTSGSLSPSLGVAIALAYLDSDLAQEGQSLTIEVRGKQLEATVVPTPFYTAGSARQK